MTASLPAFRIDSCADARASTWEMRYDAPAVGVVLSGVFNYRTPRGAATAVPGTLVFGNGGEAFSCEHLDTRGNRRAYAALTPALVREVSEDMGMAGGGFPVAALPSSRATTLLCGLIGQAARAGAANSEATVRIVAGALGLCRDAAPRAIQPGERTRVLDVVRHLDVAFDEPATLGALAARAGLTRYHFIRVFRAVTGESPARYLLGLRLRAASERLLASAEPVTSVALGVGFNDISWFNAAFRDAFGKSPRAWRGAA